MFSNFQCDSQESRCRVEDRGADFLPRTERSQGHLNGRNESQSVTVVKTGEIKIDYNIYIILYIYIYINYVYVSFF